MLNYLVRVDEWGAVVKNQSEAFKRMEEDRQRKRAEDMKNYGTELDSHIFNKNKKAQDTTNEEKQKEMQVALQKKSEFDNINMSNYEKKKQIQSMLAQEYEDMMRMKKQRSEYERSHDLQNGQMANNKASIELNYLKDTENEKKKMIKDLLFNDKLMHETNKNIRKSEEVNGVFEAKRQNEEIEKMQRNRDMAFVSRYSKFNEFQSKAAQNYNETVLKPKLEKDLDLNRFIRKQEMEAKRKADHQADLLSQSKKEWAMNNRMGIEKQLKDKVDGVQAETAVYRYDEENTKAIERDLNSLANTEMAEK